MRRQFTRGLPLLLVFALAAFPAAADEAFAATIYNPNVDFPSDADLQSLKFLEADYGLREALHLDRSWNRPFENDPNAPARDDAD